MHIRSVLVKNAISIEDQRVSAGIMVRAYRRKKYLPKKMEVLPDNDIVEKIVEEWRNNSVTPLLGRRLKENQDWEMTTSLIVDRSILPCDEVFREDVDRLRQRGYRLAQIISLGSSDERALCRFILMLLAARVSTSHQSNVDMITAVIHPSHLRFYHETMNFDLMAGGEIRCVPSANDQPGIGIYRTVQQLLKHKLTQWALEQVVFV